MSGSDDLPVVEGQRNTAKKGCVARGDDWSDGTKWTMGIVSAVLVTAVIGLAGRLLLESGGVPEQRVSFAARSDDIFAIQAEFQGSAEVLGSQMLVEVKHAEISYIRRGQSYDGPRMLVDLRVLLVEHTEEGWNTIRQSALHEVGHELQPNDTISLDPFEMTMSVKGLESLSNSWLVFALNETLPGDATVGSSYAHTRGILFAD